MAMYQLSWQVSKDPKDKTGGMMMLYGADDFSAVYRANDMLIEQGFTQGSVFHIQVKECGGRTVTYNRGF